MRKWQVITLTIVVLAVLGVSAALYTDRSEFCRSCHEMEPYYAAWRRKPHRIEACIDCHVDPGLPARFAHKLVALRELRVHVAGDPEFPVYGDQVPDDRCRRCHDPAGPRKPPAGFSHREHERAGRCEGCHASAGHRVSFEVLEAEGVLAEGAAKRYRDYYAPITASADASPTAVPQHPEVSCPRCHDMSSATCDYCHKPPKGHFTLVTCARCHEPSRPFADGDFKHSPTLDCAKCHKPPANHFPGAACRECHSPDVAFERASFSHPPVPGGEHTSRSFPCTDCHPSGFGAASCEKCHEGGAPDED